MQKQMELFKTEAYTVEFIECPIGAEYLYSESPAFDFYSEVEVLNQMFDAVMGTTETAPKVETADAPADSAMNIDWAKVISTAMILTAGLIAYL